MRAAEPRAGARALVVVVVDLEADRDLASALVRPQLYNLGPGESLSFAASRPHRVANRTDSVAVATWLTVVGSTGPVDDSTGR